MWSLVIQMMNICSVSRITGEYVPVGSDTFKMCTPPHLHDDSYLYIRQLSSVCVCVFEDVNYLSLLGGT